MKLSTNFVKDYIDIDVNAKQIAEDMTRVGNEYEEAGKLINATKLIIGEVISCDEHPESDHLHVCKVNIGNEILEIVCGAPNVRKGLKVIVAMVGAVLPGDFAIKARNVLGIASNGMMCSIAELGIDNKFLTEEDKNGIFELGEDAIIGEDPIKYLELDDEVIDFELTANRGDLLSVLGMAYELGAIYNKEVKEIDISHNEIGEDINKSFNVKVETDNCKLFLVKKVIDVEIKESPKFIKNRLIASGIRPINNVVDISNYVMLELGQPLHFYDADRLKNNLTVRMAKPNEKILTLDNIERELSDEDIVISDGDKAIGLAGVMGGQSTEVENETKNIIIESAIFDSTKVRKTSKKILRSEASNRFEKGLDPSKTYIAIERACTLLEKYAGAKIVTGIVKYENIKIKEKEIELNINDINSVLGTNMTIDNAVNVFKRLKFKTQINNDTIKVTVPTRRTDIGDYKEELIEGIGRIYGVDNIKGRLPVISIKPGSYNKTIRKLRNKLIDLGLNETLTYSLVNNEESYQYMIEKFETVKLQDPMTEDRGTLRYSMIPSLMKVYNYNNDRNIKDITLFEIGKGFYKNNETYGEKQKLCVLMTGEYYLGIENKKDVDFYIIKGIAEEILDYLGYGARYSFIINEQIPKEMHPGQSALVSVNNDVVGIIGKVHPNITKNNVFVMEIDLDKLLTKKVGKMKYKEISKYPSIKKDLAFIVDKNITSEEIAKLIKKAGSSLLTKIEVFDVYQGNNLEENKKSIAYNLTFSDNKRTLNDEEVNNIFNKIIDNIESKGIAKLRN